MADVDSHFHFSKTQDHPMNIAWYGYEFKIMLTSVTLRSFIQQNWIKLTSIKSPVNKPVSRKVPRLSIQYYTRSFLRKFHFYTLIASAFSIKECIISGQKLLHLRNNAIFCTIIATHERRTSPPFGYCFDIVSCNDTGVIDGCVHINPYGFSRKPVNPSVDA